MIQDVRFALRRLAARPAFTGLMVFIIAVGIGASTAVFTIVDQTLFRLPPFANAARLVQVIHVNRPGGGGGNALNPDKLPGWRGQQTIFERFEAYVPQTFEIVGDGEPERLFGMMVTPGLLDMLGASPQLGRRFASPDGAARSEPVVIISDGIWKRRFGADPAVIGLRINLKDAPHHHYRRDASPVSSCFRVPVLFVLSCFRGWPVSWFRVFVAGYQRVLPVSCFRVSALALTASSMVAT
jgi:hypothetical protein